MEQMHLVEFEWWRCLDGYRLHRSGLDSISERFEQYRPLDTPALFAIFADAPHTAEGMRDFANHYGLLGSIRPDITWGRGKPKFESVVVDDLLRHHTAMRRGVYLYGRHAWAQLTKLWNETTQGPALLRPELRANPNGVVRMILVPPDLIRAMWHQLGEDVCRALLFRCQRCNKAFTVGTGTGRRRTAMYCSNACKVAAYQTRRRGEN